METNGKEATERGIRRGEDPHLGSVLIFIHRTISGKWVVWFSMKIQSLLEYVHGGQSLVAKPC